MTFVERLRNEPVMLTALAVAILNILIDDKAEASRWVDLAKVVVPLGLGMFARQQVTGPVTSEKIAQGNVNPPASPEAVAESEKILE